MRPLFQDYMNQHSQDFFGDVLAGLDLLGIGYEIDPRLVRGLDYYTHTAFEFVTDALGGLWAVFAGGRYDGLIEQIGGPATPGFGWAGGIERLAMLSGVSTAVPKPIVLVPIGDAAETEALKWAHWLRRKGLIVELGFKGNAGKRMKRADRLGAAATLIFGDEELGRDVMNLKDLATGEQREVPVGDVFDALWAYEEARA